MDVCIRCNPCWSLQKDADGKEFCPICGDKFIKETQPEPQPAPQEQETQ